MRTKARAAASRARATRASSHLALLLPSSSHHTFRHSYTHSHVLAGCQWTHYVAMYISIPRLECRSLFSLTAFSPPLTAHGAPAAHPRSPTAPRRRPMPVPARPSSGLLNAWPLSCHSALSRLMTTCAAYRPETPSVVSCCARAPLWTAGGAGRSTLGCRARKEKKKKVDTLR